jgi:hypothetical protein
MELNSPVALFPVANLDARLRKMLPGRFGARSNPVNQLCAP